MFWPKVDINAKVEGINIDRGLQQTLNTKNLWLNVIITHSELFLVHLYAYFQLLFQLFLQLSHPYNREDIILQPSN